MKEPTVRPWWLSLRQNILALRQCWCTRVGLPPEGPDTVGKEETLLFPSLYSDGEPARDTDWRHGRQKPEVS